MRFGRLELYIMGRCAMAVAAAFAVIASMVLLIDLVENLRDFGVRADVSFPELLWLTLLKSPSVVLLLLPFIFLFGTLAAFVGLNRSSELVAMRAAGVSAWRFVLPAGLSALVFGVLTVTALNPAASAMNAKFEVTRSRLMDNYLSDAPKQVWLRQGDDRTQIVIHARDRGFEKGVVVLREVSLFIYQKSQTGTPIFMRRLEAASAQLLPGFWRLIDVREASPGAGSVRTETLSIRSSLDPKGAIERFASPEAIAFWKLPAAINQTRQAGFAATTYELRYHQLLATPVLLAAMSILAAAFSLRLMRLGGLALVAGAGVALGFAFYFFNAFCGALSKADVIPAALAAWAPPLVALLVGLSVLFYTEDG
jgi:lipopolysaccharide export system permease protein